MQLPHMEALTPVSLAAGGMRAMTGGETNQFDSRSTVEPSATIGAVARDVLARLSRPRIVGTLRPQWPS